MVWEPATESYDSVQSNQTAHEISYEIGRIDGIAVVLERLSQTMPDQNEFNKIMEPYIKGNRLKKYWTICMTIPTSSIKHWQMR